MFAIMTVTGVDSTGIVASVSTQLAELDVNIVDISQTLMSGFFTMILRVEFDDSATSIAEIQSKMDPVAEAKKQSIRIQSEELFTTMNEV
ncbi:ACT domain-containing protein [Corynebacterium sp. 32222D000AT]|uniref:ACT domain-containing protein n=1 Tax=Corynebacterium TaxID=1716 RepID=UPI0025B590E2|nr:ACT domain-containing protein [Corynebacterium confusum]MDD7581655.1 ACT domain-containing protein [Mycobacteriaceae bacterium]MDY5829486.1 ACT domain-containing protein [Corynebacterium sp.]